MTRTGSLLWCCSCFVSYRAMLPLLPLRLLMTLVALMLLVARTAWLPSARPAQGRVMKRG